MLRIVLDAGAEVDKQDQRKWSALMWATSNSQPQIVRLLLDYGASPTVKTGSGRTALDLLKHDDPNREIEGYLRRRQSNGNEIGNVGVSEDWYDRGFGGDVEEQFAESERKRRMMMESAFNLEVDISSLGLDEPAEVFNIIINVKLTLGINIGRGCSVLRLGEVSSRSNVCIHRRGFARIT
jgi:ankyrin repeat protein